MLRSVPLAKERAPKAAPASPDAAGALTLTVRASTVNLARFALAEAKRTGLFPASYTIEQFLEDGAYERAWLLTNKAIGIGLDGMNYAAEPASERAADGHLLLVEW